ncbi:MAG TPA: response regulator transcription factor [Burkholderiales bacterium]|nr:response regulator transcription factor [Burkholderiales bacterium]
MSPPRILVVEDDESMRELLRLHLSSAGYAVEVAEDAIAAGYSVLKAAPDLIVCDVAMPHMDGFELVAALRADAGVSNSLPVIFLTAESEGDDRARELGGEFLEKPIRLEELLAAVSRHLPLPRR